MNTNFERIHELVRKHIDADDYYLRIRQDDALQTRFGQNAVTQHMTGMHPEIQLVVAYGAQSGSSSVNQDDEESLRNLVKTTQELARLAPPDPEFVPSASPAELPAVDNFAPATAAVDAHYMVDNIARCVANADTREARISGFSSRTIREKVVFTKHGFIGEDRSTEFSHSMTMSKGPVETKVAQGVKDVSKFDIDARIAQLNDQFDALSAPQRFEPGRIPVILRPEAVANFFLYLAYLLNQREADEGTNPFTNGLGQECFGPLFSLRSTLDDPELVGSRFQGNGTPNRSVSWIEHGKLLQMAADRWYAQQKGIPASQVFNTRIEGGGTTEEAMMRQVGRGLIVNRMWYIRFIDTKKGEVTGMTRDGVLYFEDGKIRHAVNNLRFNEVLQDATQRLLAVGNLTQIEAVTKVPTMLIDGFNFVDATSF